MSVFFYLKFEVLKAMTTNVCVVLSATPVLFYTYVPIFQRKMLSSLSRSEMETQHYVG